MSRRTERDALLAEAAAVMYRLSVGAKPHQQDKPDAVAWLARYKQATTTPPSGPLLTTTPDELLTTQRAAERLGVKPQTLYLWRSKDKGPDWVRVGPKLVRYRPADIDRWLEEQS